MKSPNYIIIILILCFSCKRSKVECTSIKNESIHCYLENELGGVKTVLDKNFLVQEVDVVNQDSMRRLFLGFNDNKYSLLLEGETVNEKPVNYEIEYNKYGNRVSVVHFYEDRAYSIYKEDGVESLEEYIWVDTIKYFYATSKISFDIFDSISKTSIYYTSEISEDSARIKIVIGQDFFKVKDDSNCIYDAHSIAGKVNNNSLILHGRNLYPIEGYEVENKLDQNLTFSLPRDSNVLVPLYIYDTLVDRPLAYYLFSIDSECSSLDNLIKAREIFKSDDKYYRTGKLSKRKDIQSILLRTGIVSIENDNIIVDTNLVKESMVEGKDNTIKETKGS